MSTSKQNSTAEKLLEKVELSQGINKLLQIMQALRAPDGGCPWDLKQDFKSIIPFTIEEVYEVIEAIENEDYANLKEELGDLLFHIIFYAQIAKEESHFSFDDVLEGICEKLIHRHPHVFSDENYQDEKQQSFTWDELKKKEKASKQSSSNVENISVLDDIPRSLPELKKAQKLQKRAAKVGFDWPEVAHVWDKVSEESTEVKEAVESGCSEHIEEELGDLMFAVVNLTRHYGVDADIALRKANKKFEQRFRMVESSSTKLLSECNLDELESLWLMAKKSLKG